MTTISVVIGTYGETTWQDLAFNRAVPSVYAQTLSPASLNIQHSTSLHQARNTGADQAEGDWLCFLDADDELDAGYLAAMTRQIESLPEEDPRLLQPATLGVVGDVEDPFPIIIPTRPLIDANFLIIGTLVRRDQFLRLGGFHDYPLYEDWDLWLRCWLDGAEPVSVPDAIYRVHVNPTGRNNADRNTQVAVYNQIRSRHLAAARSRP